jgi:hypothetical protein
MLETRIPPISTRTRRSAAPTRTPGAARSFQTSRTSSVNRPLSRGNTALDPAPVAPARVQTRPSVRLNRLARSEMRLMGIATTCTAVVCGLLLLYLAAYAQVTQLGVAQSEAQHRLKQVQIKNQILRAKRDQLESPQRIIAAAVTLGMTPRGTTTINYIHAPQEPNVGEQEKAWEQGDSGDTTAKHGAASFDH